MGKTRSAYLIARIATSGSEDDLDFYDLSANQTSEIKKLFGQLGIDRSAFNSAIRHLRQALSYARAVDEFPTPTGEELKRYYQEIAKAAQKLETLLSPLDKEWHQLDRYWPEEPDLEGDKTYSAELLKNLQSLQQAASFAEEDVQTINEHANYCCRTAHQVLAVALAELHYNYGSDRPFPGDDKGPVPALYLKLCDIAQIKAPRSPRHILRYYTPGEVRASYGRPQWDFPFQHTPFWDEISDEYLKTLQALLGDSND